jgi:hypothetical protein
MPLSFAEEKCAFLLSRYFTIMEPWVLSKTLKKAEDVNSAEYKATRERLDTVLYLSIDAARMSGKWFNLRPSFCAFFEL